MGSRRRRKLLEDRTARRSQISLILQYGGPLFRLFGGEIAEHAVFRLTIRLWNMSVIKASNAKIYFALEQRMLSDLRAMPYRLAPDTAMNLIESMTRYWQTSFSDYRILVAESSFDDEDVADLQVAGEGDINESRASLSSESPSISEQGGKTSPEDKTRWFSADRA